MNQYNIYIYIFFESFEQRRRDREELLKIVYSSRERNGGRGGECWEESDCRSVCNGKEGEMRLRGSPFLSQFSQSQNHAQFV